MGATRDRQADSQSECNVTDIRADREAEGVRSTDREKTEKLQAEKWQTSKIDSDGYWCFIDMKLR
jgi:hypothetical protein